MTHVASLPKAARLAAALTVALVSVASAQVAPTGIAGGSQPFDNRQASLGITFGIQTYGTADRLGQVGMFGSNFVPTGYSPADGRLLPIAGNEALYLKLGTLYGGDGTTNFALPDLRGRAIVGAGIGAGLTPRPLGSVTGEALTTLTVNQLPMHDHTVAATPGHATQNTSITGGSQPFSNAQPTLAMNVGINELGIYPSTDNSASSPFVGEMEITAGASRAGVLPANGAVLPISAHQVLFTQLGTNFGGSGFTDFGVPNLTGRVATGVDLAQSRSIGSSFGADAVQLTQNQLPAHSHAAPVGLGTVSTVGGGQAFDNEQPSLTLHYLIALEGIFPNHGETQTGTASGTTPQEEPYLGQIKLTAGSNIPANYAEANGQILQISQFQALFALLGTQFGGNGLTNFALPDLRGYVPIGAGGDVNVGSIFGSNLYTLDGSQMPAHDHLVVVPEPALLGAMSGLLLLRRGRRRRA